jgi:hypothetical protein
MRAAMTPASIQSCVPNETSTEMREREREYEERRQTQALTSSSLRLLPLIHERIRTRRDEDDAHGVGDLTTEEFPRLKGSIRTNRRASEERQAQSV